MHWTYPSDSDPLELLGVLEEILKMEEEALEEGDWQRLEALAKEACRKIELIEEADLSKEFIPHLLLESERIEGELKERMEGIKDELALMDLSLHTHRSYMKGSAVGKEHLVLEWEA